MQKESPEDAEGIRESWRKYTHSKFQYDFIQQTLEQYEFRRRGLKAKSNLSVRFMDRTFASWNRSQFPYAYELCRKYAEGFLQNQGEGIFISGSVGTGKTHLAAAITNYVIDKLRIRAQFLSINDLLSQIRRAYQKGNSEEEIQRLKSIDLLLLDDLGKEKQSEWTQQIIFELINYRYEHNLPIVITSNYSLDEMVNRIGEACTSRIAETCAYVEMIGDDYRTGVKH